MHLLVLLHAGCHCAGFCFFFAAGPLWHFHSAVKQNASGSKSVKYQHECVHARRLPIPDGSATWLTCQRTTRVHLSTELLISICCVPSYLLFNFFFLHEQQLSMLWHFNSTTKSPPNIFISENSSKACPVSSPPTASLLTPLSPPLITKDMVIIAGGGKGQKEGACLQTRANMSSINRGKRHVNFHPDKWVLGCNFEVCHQHLVDWSVGRHVWFWQFGCTFPFSVSCRVYKHSWLHRWTDWDGGGGGDIVRGSWVTW